MKYNVEAYSFILIIHQGIIKKHSVPPHLQHSLKNIVSHCRESVDATLYRKMVHTADIHRDVCQFRKVTKQNVVFLDKFAQEFSVKK